MCDSFCVGEYPHSGLAAVAVRAFNNNMFLFNAHYLHTCVYVLCAWCPLTQMFHANYLIVNELKPLIQNYGV